MFMRVPLFDCEVTTLLQKRLQMKYPCAEPVYPHMRNEDVRFKTFFPRSVWLPLINPTEARTCAKAGFCIIDTKARLGIRCWYCNMALSDWKPEDDAFETHAKWNPE